MIIFLWENSLEDYSYSLLGANWQYITLWYVCLDINIFSFYQGDGTSIWNRLILMQFKILMSSLYHIVDYMI